MTDSDIDPPPVPAALLSCLVAMHLGVVQAECAIETLMQRGFDRSAAEIRVLSIAFSLWTPQQGRAAH
jgi:hypothetical protein